MKKVLVLGAGPAGLLAAETAVKAGGSVVVWSRAADGYIGTGKAAKSDLFGCQYLHQPVVTGLGDGQLMRYELEGSSDGYRHKVYGDNWRGHVSPDEYGPEQRHLAWDLRKAYDILWSFWSSRIVGGPDMGWTLVEGVHRAHNFDLIISTLPAPALCRRVGDADEQHSFLSQKIWAMGETPDRAVPVWCPDNTIVCNGDKDTGWYRKARVFGHTTVEYPWRDGKKPPLTGVVPVTKPLRTNCDCWVNTNVLQVGRYGKWQKGYLVHHVVEDVEHALGSL